jgi:F-type H+-transporting ATPase subunit delta
MKTTHHTPLARAYALALLQLASERKLAEAVGLELGGLHQVLDENPSFRLFLADPAIGHTARQDMLQGIFKGRVSELVYNFLGVMNEKGRLGKLGEVIDAYADLLDEQLGKVEVYVTVAHRLLPDELERVRQRVGKSLGKEAVLHQNVDDAIIGGMMLRVKDKLIDASVRCQLQAIKEKMLAGKLK